MWTCGREVGLRSPRGAWLLFFLVIFLFLTVFGTFAFCKKYGPGHFYSDLTFIGSRTTRKTCHTLKNCSSNNQRRNEVRWRPGKEASLELHVRIWGLQEANILYWIKYLWLCWDFSRLRQLFGAPDSDLTPP